MQTVIEPSSCLATLSCGWANRHSDSARLQAPRRNSRHTWICDRIRVRNRYRYGYRYRISNRIHRNYRHRSQTHTQHDARISMIIVEFFNSIFVIFFFGMGITYIIIRWYIYFSIHWIDIRGCSAHRYRFWYQYQLIG